ncbi:MAG TPA: TraB/GumN family protein [Burkholderiaceae bacterium]|nr:TraB/GumN family protein [Burkholderiaceae bacterium]
MPGRRALLRVAAAAVAGAPLVGAGGCAWRRIPGFGYAPPAFELARPGAPGRIVLLATVHAGLARFYPLPEAIERAFESAGRLYVELDVESRAAAIREAGRAFALLPDGATLETTLSPDTLAALRRAFDDRPGALHAWRRLQPWALALMLPDADDARMGAGESGGVERHLLRRARARGLPVVELETADAQVRAYAGGTLAEQEAALALRLAQREARARTFARIVDAWRLGDLDALARLKDRAYPPDGPLAPLRRRLFAERDEAIAGRLAEALEAPGAAMALLGAFHVAGPDSVLAALARRGVSVTRTSHAPSG